MPCYTPLKSFQLIGEKGLLPNGKKHLLFKRPQQSTYKEIPLPCGQCIGCRLKSSYIWASRIMHELQMTKNETACFITLTYNDKNLPQDYSLNKEHFKDFLKKFRKAIEPQKIRYFMCGEYGDETGRPHYHAIIFGYDFTKGIKYQKNWQHGRIQFQQGETENPYYLSEFLNSLWNKGNTLLTNCTFETAAYVARYCTKKVNGEKAEKHYNKLIIDWNEFTGEIYNMQESQIQPEYATMSRGRKDVRGIGFTWYKKYKSDCYPSNHLIINGNKAQIPTYYDKLLEEDNPIMLAAMKIKRELAIQQNKADYTPQRLAQRHFAKKQQSISLKRNKI